MSLISANEARIRIERHDHHVLVEEIEARIKQEIEFKRPWKKENLPARFSVVAPWSGEGHREYSDEVVTYVKNYLMRNGYMIGLNPSCSDPKGIDLICW